MTEQENKARFRQAIDRTLSGLEGNPYLFQRVAANAEKGANNMKHHFPKGVLIALIVLLCMGTAALAAGGLLGGTVNWLGQIVQGNELPYVIWERTEAQEAVSQKLNDWMALLKTDFELVEVTVRTADGLFCNAISGLKRTASDLPGFETLMVGAQNIPTPQNIPAGYELVSGTIEYGCRSEGEWHMLEDMTLEAGVTAQRYVVDEADSYVHGYDLLLRNPAAYEDFLFISVELAALGDAANQDIVFGAGQEVRIVDVPGMDNAVLLWAEYDHHLTMRQRLSEPVAALDFRRGMVEYGDVKIDVIASTLDVDALICMFSAE